jgi:small subunit ribosomal protein S16
MLTIRLQRTGKKNQADFRIVLAEKESPVQKKFVEILGSYNPRKKNFKVFEERVKYWIGQNIEMSETVNNLLITKGFLNTKKVKAFTIPKKPVAAEAAPAAEASAKVETPAEVKEATVEMEAKIEQAEAAPQDKTPEQVAEAPKEETPVT